MCHISTSISSLVLLFQPFNITDVDYFFGQLYSMFHDIILHWLDDGFVLNVSSMCTSVLDGNCKVISGPVLCLFLCWFWHLTPVYTCSLAFVVWLSNNLQDMSSWLNNKHDMESKQLKKEMGSTQGINICLCSQWFFRDFSVLSALATHFSLKFGDGMEYVVIVFLYQILLLLITFAFSWQMEMFLLLCKGEIWFLIHDT